MKKKMIIGAVGVAVLAYLGTIGFVHYADSERSAKLVATVAEPKGNADIRTLFYEKGCDYCHTANTELPFYASLPIAKQLMKHDVVTGNRYFDLSPTMTSLVEGTPVAEADLAKIERVIKNDQMPPQQYILMHVSAGLNETQRQQILNWVAQQRETYYTTPGVAAVFKNEVVQPIPESIPTDPNKVALGFALYHDTRLSGDNSLSCESCHKLDAGGVDNLVTSTGINGQKGPINAPTVFNSTFNTAQFWDGRAANLQEQAGGPPLNPIEMGSHSWQQIIDKLSTDPKMVQAFAKAYPNGGISSTTITDAIAEFEKTVITPNSPFDRYLKGDTQALTANQIRGFDLFKENRCDTCHVGKNLGGQSYEFMGLKGDYFADRGTEVGEVDMGRHNLSKLDSDRFRFKTPTLRNIEQTAPYMHDGSIKDLHQAVQVMLKYQVGKTLPEHDVNDIVAFLQSLTGEYQPYQPK